MPSHAAHSVLSPNAAGRAPRTVRERSLGGIVALSLVTVGLYQFYWLPSVSTDINQIPGCKQRSWGLILFLSIITLGLAGMIYEIGFAYDLSRQSRTYPPLRGHENLGTTVLVLDLLAIAVGIVSGGLALLLSWAIGVWAMCLVQAAVNRVASS